MENENTGRVTLDDVRKQLLSADIDPRKTNSGAVRRMLGRGSMGTIQKYLEVLRTELEPAAPVLEGSIPATPKTLADVLWESAWTAAQASTAQALAKALLERDVARDVLAATAADLDAMSADTDAALASASAATTAQATAEAAQATAEAAQTVAESSAAEAAEAAAEAAKLALERCTADAAAAASAAADAASKNALVATAELDRIRFDYDLRIAHQETQIATLNGVIDRLNEQLAEVKSLLPRIKK